MRRITVLNEVDEILIDKNDRVIVYVHVSSVGMLHTFPEQTLFRELLVDFFTRTLDFFHLPSSCSTKTPAKPNASRGDITAYLEHRYRQRGDEAAYMVWVNIGGMSHEITFPRSCPENLEKLRRIVDGIFSWVQNPRRQGDLFLLLDSLLD